MKVLTFITNISQRSGGPSRSVPLLVKGLAEMGVDITLMVQRSDDMNIHALKGTNAKLKILEKGYSNKYLENYIISEGFDIIQCQSMWDLRYHKLIKIAIKHNIPYIITPRGMLEPWSLSQSKWKKRIAMMLYQFRDLKRAACIYTTAEMEAMHIRELGVKVPISVIPNGINTQDYPCRTSIAGIKKQILFLSRIHEKKGIELLIDAWSHLKTNFPDWSIEIFGNGEKDYIETLNHKIRSLNLENNIKINGPIFSEDKIRLYQESSLFCLPSFSENFGMVIGEAMSCGVPVITTTNCPWSILNKTKTGWCIDLSVDNIVRTLREAMTMNPHDLYEMGQKGSILVNKHYTYQNISQRTIELYNWILTNNNKPQFVL